MIREHDSFRLSDKKVKVRRRDLADFSAACLAILQHDNFRGFSRPDGASLRNHLENNFIAQAIAVPKHFTWRKSVHK